MDNPATNDPLVRSIRRAYRNSKQFEWDQLCEEESRWKRKLTIAANKLTDVRNRMNAYAAQLVKESVEKAK